MTREQYIRNSAIRYVLAATDHTDRLARLTRVKLCWARFDVWARKRRDVTPCQHPPQRLYAWHAADGVQCVACCKCGKVLAGAA